MTYYKVAEIVFGVQTPFPDKINDELLPSYVDFKTKEINDILFTLECVPFGSFEDIKIEKLADGESDLGCWSLYAIQNGFCIDLTFRKGFPSHRMVCDKNFGNCKAAIMFEEPHGRFVLNSFIMMAYSQICTLRNAATIHSSVIMMNGYGYLFLGKSGTGKSTHSRQWLKYLPNTELLNDDNPAIRVEGNGDIKVYGTPWSGKTPCYKNKNAKIKGFVKLVQGPVNKARKLNGIEAYIVLLSSCSTSKWNMNLFNSLGKNLETITNNIPGILLENLPNEEAAILCYNTLETLHKNITKSSKNGQSV